MILELFNIIKSPDKTFFIILIIIMIKETRIIKRIKIIQNIKVIIKYWIKWKIINNLYYYNKKIY